MKANSFFTKSKYLPFGLKPNAEVEQDTPYFKATIQINSLGYRDVEFSIQKAPGVIRILCLGDSFTLGSGVDLMDTYPKALEQRLRAQHPTLKIEVINAGFASGDSTDTAYLYLKNQGLALDPDFVFLGFLPRGDIDEMMERDTRRCVFDESGLPLKIRSKHFDEYFNTNRNPPASLRYKITRRLRDLFPRWDRLLTFLDIKFPVLRKRAAFAQQWLPGMSHVFQSAPYTAEMENAWVYFEKLVVAMQAMAQAKNCHFTTMVIPSNFQCSPRYWKELGCPVDRGIYDHPRPQSLARDICRKHRIDFLDLLPAFQKEDRTQLFFPIDGHINKAGCHIAARVMADHLNAKLTALSSSSALADRR